MNTYIVGTHYKHLNEVLLMSTHNVCFHAEIRKNIYPLPSRATVNSINFDNTHWCGSSLLHTAIGVNMLIYTHTEEQAAHGQMKKKLQQEIFGPQMCQKVSKKNKKCMNRCVCSEKSPISPTPTPSPHLQSH